MNGMASRTYSVPPIEPNAVDRRPRAKGLGHVVVRVVPGDVGAGETTTAVEWSPTAPDSRAARPRPRRSPTAAALDLVQAGSVRHLPVGGRLFRGSRLGVGADRRATAALRSDRRDWAGSSVRQLERLDRVAKLPDRGLVLPTAPRNVFSSALRSECSSGPSSASAATISVATEAKQHRADDPSPQTEGAAGGRAPSATVPAAGTRRPAR